MDKGISPCRAARSWFRLLTGKSLRACSTWRGVLHTRGSPVLKTFVVGYANGNVGYIQTARAFEEGGYEVESAHKFYYGVYCFTPEVEKAIVDAGIVLAQELADRP